MPKREDIKSILIVGAGPIIIGQACEFDYSGTQACKALKEEGYRVILVNSNPATIMTDPHMAHATYIEPITPEIVEKIVQKERPDALLPTMGGQTALNVSVDLDKSGVLQKYGCEIIGANSQVIAKAEDRKLFRDAMDKIGLATPKSLVVKSMDEAQKALLEISLPLIVRPSFTLGGIGGGIAYNRIEYEKIVGNGLNASPIGEVLLEESVLGWKEYEMEVVRDKADNCIIVCSIENIDPMGVHTGDSITVAPALTLTDKEYQIMRDASIAVLREIGVDTGGSNVQFAVNPENGRLVIIEMNPRVSRSSALASKATGFPIARIAAKLAIGYTLDELDNDITKTTPASFEPTIDYVVTKIPRFTFEKFPGTEALLTTSMKSVGEVMAIGRTFKESLQKGLRSMETGLIGLDRPKEHFENDPNRQSSNQPVFDELSVLSALASPRPDRLLVIAEAFRLGVSFEKIHDTCHYDPWFLRQIEDLVLMEKKLQTDGLPTNAKTLLWYKKAGFSDKKIAALTGKKLKEVQKRRYTLGVFPAYKRVDTCAAEFPADTPYMYSCYEGDSSTPPECESEPTDRPKVIILGGGPNRIGQGVEFDYCCVHAAYTLRDINIEAIMVNCNPETVSTDYDTSDRLYFEPLTDEDVMEVIRKEQSKGNLMGCIVQFGGQTPLKLVAELARNRIAILGTSPDAIDLAEDRERFQHLLLKLGLKQPQNGLARSLEEAKTIADSIGYPLVLRPSYVLGGRAMEIVHNQEALIHYMEMAVQVSGDSPVLLDSYLQDATEVDVDAVCDGEDVYIAGIMQHIEEAGIHSGDSACSLPSHSLEEKITQELERQTSLLAKALGVVGLMNVQYAVKEEDIYILEVNPRASRTVPFVAKATGVPVVGIATQVMSGAKLASLGLKQSPKTNHISVKEAVFPFSRFPGVDVILGPEMKSTGEVMGIDLTFPRAFAKSQLGANIKLPLEGTVFISVKNRDKSMAAKLARRLHRLGFCLMATKGTAACLQKEELPVRPVKKVLEGRPHCEDAIVSGEVQLIINTTEGAQAIADSYSIRRSALMQAIPHYTTITGAEAVVSALEAIKQEGLEVRPLQDYLRKLPS